MKVVRISLLQLAMVPFALLLLSAIEAKLDGTEEDGIDDEKNVIVPRHFTPEISKNESKWMHHKGKKSPKIDPFKKKSLAKKDKQAMKMVHGEKNANTRLKRQHDSDYDDDEYDYSPEFGIPLRPIPIWGGFSPRRPIPIWGRPVISRPIPIWGGFLPPAPVPIWGGNRRPTPIPIRGGNWRPTPIPIRGGHWRPSPIPIRSRPVISRPIPIWGRPIITRPIPIWGRPIPIWN